jgi:hypothetical protein
VPDLRILLSNTKPNPPKNVKKEVKENPPLFTLKVANMWRVNLHASFLVYMKHDLFPNMCNYVTF